MYNIRYSNCWEDTDVLLEAIKTKANGSYLSIASAGDNTLALLSCNPKIVMAVDINPSQIAALEIRKAAFQILEYDDLLKFLGIKPFKDRLAVYVKLRHELNPNERYFWDKNPLSIEQGLIHCGRVENYLRKFRTWILPLLISKKKRRRLFEPQTGNINVLSKDDLSSWRWKIFTRLFFSKIYLAKIDLGRSKAILHGIDQDIPELVLSRIQRALTNEPVAANPYLEYIILGNYHRNLPFYLRKENFDSIRNNLDKLIIFSGGLTQALDKYSDLGFSGLNLSDIFEYISDDKFDRMIMKILDHCRPGARIVFWNNLLERIPTPIPGRLKILTDEARELFRRNRSFFYGSLIIGETANG